MYEYVLFRLFGWVTYSERSRETENVLLGATLEIQRLQREEILEQQIMRQQVCFYEKIYLELLRSSKNCYKNIMLV